MTSSTSSSRGAVKLLLNIGLLGMIILAINQMLLTLLPYPWGEVDFKDRFSYYLDNQGAFDTVFIGSSISYRHVDPDVFQQDSTSAHAYNLGAPANFFPKTQRTFREVLANSPDELETIIFEVTRSEDLPDQDNWHTLRQVYWYDLEGTQYLLRSLWQSDVELEDKLRYSAVHGGTLIEKNINFGLGVKVLSHFREGLKKADNNSDKLRSGFFPLDRAAEMASGGTRRSLLQRREDLLEDPESLSAVAETTRGFYTDPASWGTVNEAQLDKLNEMRVLAEEQDIELVFVLPPRLDYLYEDLLPLYDALPPSQRIDLVSPDEYPEFYSLENSFDLFHLNSVGAEKYTRALAREFSDLFGEE